MTIQVDEIAEIAVDVWAALLARDLIPAALVDGELSERAQVTIEGACNGRVRVETSHALARQLTAHLQKVPEDEVGDELVADALGELVSILGGNIKALLPAPSHLGLPGPPGGVPAEVVVEVWMACDDEPVLVVVERLLPVEP